MTLKSRLAKLEAERPHHDVVQGEHSLEGKSIEELTALYKGWTSGESAERSRLEGLSIDELMALYKQACR